MFTGVELLVAPVLLFAVPPEELTLQQVLKANTAAIQAIRSLHVTIEVAHNLSVPGEEKPPLEAQPTYVLVWRQDGARVRVSHMWLRGRGPKPFDVHSEDRSNGPNGLKAIYNYDPNVKPPLSESFESHANGEIDRTQMEESLTGSPRAMCYMMFEGSNLEGYVAKYPRSKLAATPAASKFGCYEITTLEEKSTLRDPDYDVHDMRIFVDPKASFWVRRIEKGPWQKSTNPGDKGTTIIEVQEFKNCGNGIFWPLRAYHRTRLPGGTSGPDIFVRHTLRSINAPLPNEDFEIHFPDWLRVHDRISGKLLIWGPDDKPRMTFASQSDYEKWYEPRAEDRDGTGGVPKRMRPMLLTAISILVGLGLLLILWQRSKRVRRLKAAAVDPDKISPPDEP